MDIPVVIIKLRDYLFWFVPAYLVAIALGAAAEVALRRLLALPSPYAGVPVSAAANKASATNAATSERNLLLEIWLRVTGRVTYSHDLPLQLYLWSSISAHSLSWVALLVTAQLGWALALARIGFALILASLLAVLVPRIVSESSASPIRPPASDTEARSARPHIEWWRGLQKRFSDSSNDLVMAALIAALLFGLSPGLYSILGTALITPFSYLSVAAIGILTPFVPGTEAPFVAVLQTKGVGPGATMAFMLAVSATPWLLLRDTRRRFGLRVVAIYIGVAFLLAVLLGVLAEPLLTAVGLI